MRRIQQFAAGNGGFSLVELLVTIVVAGILAGVVWPRLALLAPKYRLEGAARSIAAEIQRARGRAIGEGKCAIVAFDATAKTYRVGVASASTCPTAFGSYTLETAKSIEDTATITIENAASLGSPPADPVFNPRGGTDVVSSIRFANTLGDARLVVVNAAGRVLIQ
jgi:prepilin-type N-terminal cleavage/methylation domain-containing protein